MRKVLKRMLTPVLVPLTRWYLRKERKYTYEDITIRVSPGVFHPGLFHSTTFLLKFLSTQDLQDKTLLELGCGTGLISIAASKAHAIVTASDLSRKAAENCRRNLQYNNAVATVIHSDLFDNLAGKTFDWIIINPPYYAQKPEKDEDLAWYCGVDFEYFRKLFRQLPDHLHASSKVIMVLTKGCDREKIFSIAEASGFRFTEIQQHKVFFDETDFLYCITPTTAAIRRV